MIEDRCGELALLRLDPGPLHREAIRIQTQPRQGGDVLRIAVIVVAGVTRRLGEDRVRKMLEQPAVAIDVVALHLVGRRRSAPKKLSGNMGTFKARHRLWSMKCSDL